MMCAGPKTESINKAGSFFSSSFWHYHFCRVGQSLLHSLFSQLCRPLWSEEFKLVSYRIPFPYLWDVNKGLKTDTTCSEDNSSFIIRGLCRGNDFS